MSLHHKDEFQVRLSLLQVVFLVGLILGCLVAVYVAGYVSGDSGGYERAMRSSVKNFIPFAIEEEKKTSEKELQEKSTEIYARLQEKSGGAKQEVLSEKDIPIEQTNTNDEDDGMPEVAQIENSENKPLPLERQDEPKSGNDIAEDNATNTTTSAIAALAEDQENQGSLENTEKNTRETQDEELHSAGDGEVKLSEILAKSPSGAPRENSAADNDVDKQNSVRENEDDALQVEKTDSFPDKEEEALVEATPTPKPSLVPPSPPPPHVNSKVTAGWYAQVAAPSTLAEASALSAKLRSSGFPVRIETASVRGQQYFRVLAGPESSQTYAQRLVGQLKREPGIRSEPFVKYVQ